LPAVAHEFTVSGSEEILARRLLSDVRAGREDDPLGAAVAVVRSNLVGLQLSRRLAREAGGYANVRFLTLLDLASFLAGPGVVPREYEEVKGAIREEAAKAGANYVQLTSLNVMSITGRYKARGVAFLCLD